MKKSRWILILGALALVGIGFWLLRSADPDQLQRSETVIDVKDTFEK